MSCRYSLENLPRDMQLNPALNNRHYDFTWVPAEPPDQPDADGDHAKASNDALPLVKFGKSGRSPVWEGQPYATMDFPTETARRRSASPVRDYTRAYPDRCDLLHD